MKQVPLSIGQRALLLHHQTAPATPAYHIGYLAEINGPVLAKLLEQCINNLISRHELLRAQLRIDAGEANLYIQERSPLSLTEIELSDEHEIEAFLRKEYERPFDLGQAPLLRCTLIKTGDATHLLLFTIHHLIFDGSSLWLMLRELQELYEKSLVRRPVQEVVAPSFTDFTQWQSSYLKSNEGEMSKAYWRERLAGIPHVLSLPTDRARPYEIEYRGATHRKPVSQDLVETAREYCREQGVTLTSLLLATFSTLLYRYSKQEKFVVGCAATGRIREEDRGTIGYFTNLMPLPFSIESDTTFTSHLHAVHVSVISSLQHQAYPLPLIVEALSPTRDPSIAPLVQVTFAHQKVIAREGRLGRASITPLPFDQQEGQFDLELEVIERDGIETLLKYSSALWDSTTIERMHEQLHTLLRSAVSTPHLPLRSLHLLSSLEKQKLLRKGRRVSPQEREGKTLPELFRDAVERYSDNRAVSDEYGELTYKELDELTNSLAHALIEKGVTQGDRVGLTVERSASIVVGILGILKAGAAYVPLDPTYPQERLLLTIEDGDLSLLLGDQSLSESLIHELKIPFLALDQEKLGAYPRHASPLSIDDSAIAYIIYTSGSTGRPKGVKVSHRNVRRLFKQTQQWYGFNEEDVWTLFHSYAFDFSVWEMWGALLYGGRVVVVPSCVARSPRQFLELLSREKITVLNQTPSAFLQLAQVDEASPSPLNLRYVIFGGEALELASLKNWFERRGDTSPQLINMYGITETTVHVTYRPISRADLLHRRSVIGEPIPDLSLYILDSELEPVPVGVPGEMYVGGEGVALGYHRREELSAQRFLEVPFDEGRVYKTGDLARMLPDGDIEYLGRIDHQVKIRGFRVELGEIETKLLELPSVTAALVLLLGDKDDQRLVAFIASHEPIEHTAKEHLKRSLPHYMLPGRIIVVDAFPLTNNGKTDRDALVEQYHKGRNKEMPVQCLSETEKRVATIWSELLGRSDIRQEDRFFDIGGHSFLAPRLLSRVEQEFKVELPLSALFQQQSLSAMSNLIDETKAKEEGSSLFSISIPLSRNQGKPTLFSIAGGGGSALYYRELAETITSASVLGLQAEGVDGRREPLTDVDAICDRYIKEIQRHDPYGPYYLAGHCFGGLIAHAVAQRLTMYGARIALVTIIDAPAPIGLKLSEATPTDDLGWMVKIGSMMGESFGVQITLDPSTLAPLTPDQRLALLHQELEAKKLYPPATSPLPLKGMIDLFKVHSRLSFDHDPGRKTPLLLMRAREHHPDYDFSVQERQHGLSLGWHLFGDPFYGAIISPGSHLSMMRAPNINFISKAIDEVIQSVAKDFKVAI